MLYNLIKVLFRWLFDLFRLYLILGYTGRFRNPSDKYNGGKIKWSLQSNYGPQYLLPEISENLYFLLSS